MFGVNVDNPDYGYRLSRFTGTLSFITFIYHDGTPAVDAADVVLGLNPAAMYNAWWTLILRDDLSLSAIRDFSSGTQIGYPSANNSSNYSSTNNYRIGLTGAQIQAWAPTRLRIQTGGGLSEDFEGPFDFNALDGVCTRNNCNDVPAINCSSAPIDNCTNVSTPAAGNCSSCNCTGNTLRSDLFWHAGCFSCVCVPELYWHFGLSRDDDVYSDCIYGGGGTTTSAVLAASQHKWGHFYRKGGQTTGVYVFGGVCVSESDWGGEYSLYVMTTSTITTTTITTTAQPVPWDWGGTLHGGFTLRFTLTIDSANYDAQALFVRCHKKPLIVDGGAREPFSLVGVAPSDDWVSPTTPGANVKMLYLDTSRRICFKTGNSSYVAADGKLYPDGRCVQHRYLSHTHEISLKSSPGEGYVISVDGREEHDSGHDPLRPDDPDTEFMFGVAVEQSTPANGTGLSLLLSRFTGQVRNVDFVYHDGTAVVVGHEAVLGLSPAATFQSPWTLILRGDLSSHSLRDFSSGASVGGSDLVTRPAGGAISSNYRIGLTGADIHAYAPTRLRIHTIGGLGEEFAGPFDFNALDGVCITVFFQRTVSYSLWTTIIRFLPPTPILAPSSTYFFPCTPRHYLY